MKLFKEGLVRIDCGSAFHNFEAEYEKERSYNAVRDLGTERSPFSDDLKERVWVSDTGLSRPDIYAGVKLLCVVFSCVLSLSLMLSWVGCCAWLCRFLIFTFFLSLSHRRVTESKKGVVAFQSLVCLSISVT